MTNITVNEKTDINPMGFTYTPTPLHDWVSEVAKAIKETFEPIGLDSVVLLFFNYRVDGRSNSYIKDEFQCLALDYVISEEAKQKYPNFKKSVNITLVAVGGTEPEFPIKNENTYGHTLSCDVYDMIGALHLFNMLQIAVPIRIDHSRKNELNEECCRPFEMPYQTNGEIYFDL